MSLPRKMALALLLPLMACGVTPERNVLPFPEHIRAGVAAGDRVSIVTHDNQRIEMQVDRVTADALSNAERTVAFKDIASLSKRSLAPVRNPCDDGRPLGCSIPTVVTVLSEYHAEFGAVFDIPCTQHDFCYAYGQRTYGHDKTLCDQVFFDDMQTLCESRSRFNLVERANCLLAAEQLIAAVKMYGDDHFLGETSQYCEYAGPP